MSLILFALICVVFVFCVFGFGSFIELHLVRKSVCPICVVAFFGVFVLFLLYIRVALICVVVVFGLLVFVFVIVVRVVVLLFGI